MPLAQRSRRRLILAACTALAAIGLVIILVMQLAGPSETQSLQPVRNEPAIARDIGAGVKVDGDSVPTNLEASVIDGTPSALAGLSPASYETLTPTIEIGPSGRLPGLTKFSLPLDRIPADGGMPIVMTRPSEGGDWQMIENARYNADRTRIEFETDHLSVFEAYNNFMNRLLDPLSEFLTKGLGGGVLHQDEPPKCEGTNKAQTDGYTAKVDTKLEGALAWCYGFEKGSYIVRVVSYRGYPVEVKLTNATLVPDGDLRIRADSVLEALKKVIMMPGETATFRIKDLAKGSSAKLEITRSPFTHNLEALDIVTATTIKSFLGKSDKVSAQMAREVVWTRECYNALNNPDRNLLEIDESCLDLGFFEKLVGKTVARIVKRAGSWLIGGGLIRGFLESYTDNQRKRDTHLITVSRAAGLDKYVGEWQHTDSNLSVRSDGTARLKTTYYAQNTGTPFSYSADLVLTPSSDGSSLAAKYQNVVWSGPGAETDISLYEGVTPGDGDTARVSLNADGQLIIDLLGRLSDVDDGDEDGRVDPFFTYCGKPTRAGVTCEGG